MQTTYLVIVDNEVCETQDEPTLLAFRACEEGWARMLKVYPVKTNGWDNWEPRVEVRQWNPETKDWQVLADAKVRAEEQRVEMEAEVKRRVYKSVLDPTVRSDHVDMLPNFHALAGVDYQGMEERVQSNAGKPTPAPAGSPVYDKYPVLGQPEKPWNPKDSRVDPDAELVKALQAKANQHNLALGDYIQFTLNREDDKLPVRPQGMTMEEYIAKHDLYRDIQGSSSSSSSSSNPPQGEQVENVELWIPPKSESTVTGTKAHSKPFGGKAQAEEFCDLLEHRKQLGEVLDFEVNLYGPDWVVSWTERVSNA